MAIGPSLFVLENLGNTQTLEPAGVTQKQCEARALTESLLKRKLELQAPFPPLHSWTMRRTTLHKWNQRDFRLRHLHSTQTAKMNSVCSQIINQA